MSESIGQRLKQAREVRYLTLEKASDDTRIRVIFLQALELDDYSSMPSAAQGRGFLRNYAEYLGLNVDEMIADLQKNTPSIAEVSGPLPQVNLVETEIPPLADSQDKKTAPPFWTSWFAPRPKAESNPETESIEPVQEESPASLAETEATGQPKPRGGKKVDEEASLPAEGTGREVEAGILPVEIEQVEDKDEVKPNLISKLISFIQVRRRKESDIAHEIEADESEPAFEPQIKQEAPSMPADLIFAEIGARLRERRELISLTVEEVERHTRLRAVFVKALEEGSFDKLPSPVQTRGMLANYSAFLDLDTDTILLRFADALQARRREKYAETPREKIQMEVVTFMPFLRTFIAGDLIFGVAMIAILIALAIWGVGRVISLQDARNQITQPAPLIVDMPGDAPLPTASLELTFVAVDDIPLGTSPAEGAFTTQGAPTPGTNANVVVNVFAVERVFVRISVDGTAAFEGRMAPRETKVFEADDQVVILTGNAAAIRVTYNGRDLGLMGGVGEVVSRVYLVSGIATPTATIPPTPTNTQPVTSTPTATITPTATPTVRPPDGG